MKKILAILLIICVVCLPAACTEGSGSNADANVEGALSELLPKVTQGIASDELAVMETEVTSDMFTFYFNIDYIEGAEAMASDALISSVAHSIALIRLPEGTDYDKVVQDITDNIDPRRWICVEAESTQVVRRGNLVLVALSATDTVEKAVANFNAL